jgi:protein disulfide-isomerase A1
MFYAPWCGHCKKLMPVWEELAKEMASNSDIVMAKFDATLNEVDGVQVKGYPTLKFYSKDNKSGEDVKSGRNLPELKKYLEENASSLKTEKSVQHDEL